MISKTRAATLLGAAVACTLVVAGPADARRGGSFGSRGSRTYAAPRATPSTPRYVPPVQRSMTERPAEAPRSGAGAPASGYSQRPYQPGYANATAPVQRSRFGGLGGFGGGFLGGLLTGGLIGGLMGHGWGGGWGGMGMGMGGAGLFTWIIQIGLILLAVSLLMRLFRRRQQPAAAGWPSQSAAAFESSAPWGGPQPVRAPEPAAPTGPALEIPVTQADRDTFERLLLEVQDAFAREDYAALRARTTPEVMSYLAEELSDNATHGRRNQVSGTRLVDAEVSEAWREGASDYATAQMTYESVDVMVDRNTGAVLEGDVQRPTRTTELWTFIRQAGQPWKLSAIQEV